MISRSVLRRVRFQSKPCRLDPKVRREVIKRDGGVCQKCHGPDHWLGVDVAHIVALGMGASRANRDDARNHAPNLVLLCRPCHDEQTRNLWTMEEHMPDEFIRAAQYLMRCAA